MTIPSEELRQAPAVRTRHARRAHEVRTDTPRIPPQAIPPRAAITTQRLGASELLFIAMRRFTPTNVVRFVSIEGRLPPQTVAAAIRLLEHRHPMLRATMIVEGVPRFAYDSALPVRLHVDVRRDDDHAVEVVERLLRRTMPTSPDALFEVHLLTDASGFRSDLILVGDHALCDGISMNALSAELIGLCSGETIKGPRKTLPVLAHLLPSYSVRDRIASTSLAIARLAKVAVLRSVFETRSVATGSSYASVELDRAQTERAIERARAADTTVSGTLMASALHAIRAQRPVANQLAMSVPVNLRPRIPRWNLTPDDLGNYTNATYLASSPSNDLFADARDLKGQLDRALDDDGLLASLPIVFHGGRLILREGRVPFAHAMMSNSGVVPMRRDYRGFRVTSFRSATSAPMISADLAFFCNTFDGRLTINLVFAEEVISREDARRLLDAMTDLLVGGGPS